MPVVPSMLRIPAGAMVWALHFTVIYGFTALACGRGLPATAVPWVVVIATILAAAVSVRIVLTGLRESARFDCWLSAALAGLALIAIILEAMAALMVPVCA